MKRLLLIFDRLICGKTAAALGFMGGLLLLVVWLRPLPREHFPNVVRMFSASWLYLAISVSIAYSAAAVIAKRQGTATDMWTCLTLGVLWASTPWFAFLPFNFSRLLLIYGLAGVVAHCIRRSRSSAPPPMIVASLPAKQTEPGPFNQPEGNQDQGCA